MGRVIIFETDRLRVVAQDLETSDVCISFNELGATKNGDRFWGDEFFAKRGLSSIGIVTTEPNWYPEADMVGALEVIRKATNGKRIVTYGHSQGGYGALKYGAALGASLTLAFSPQWSIDPGLVAPFDNRYCHHFRPEWRNGHPVLPSDIAPSAVVIYDPGDVCDALHAARLVALPGVSTAKAPLCGHDTIRVLTESGTASGLIDLMRQQDSEPNGQDLRALIRASRAMSRTYRSRQIFAIVDRFRTRPGWFEALLAALPQGSQNFAKIFLALDKRQATTASSIMAQMSDEDLFRFGFIRIWTLFREHEFLEGELRLASCLETHFKGNCFVLLHAVETLIKIGDVEGAQRELDRIVRNSDVGSHRPFVARLQRQISALS